MPDHVHVLLEDRDVVAFVRAFKGRMTSHARKLSVRALWQRSFHDRALRSEDAVERAALYVWLNPVEAGLADDPSSYAGSGSLAWPNWREAISEGTLLAHE